MAVDTSYNADSVQRTITMCIWEYGNANYSTFTWGYGHDAAINNDDLVLESFSLSKTLVGTETLKFGGCAVGKLEFTTDLLTAFDNTAIVWDKARIAVRIAPSADSTSYTYPGWYTVQDFQRSADKKTVSITAYDLMYDIINTDITSDLETFFESYRSNLQLYTLAGHIESYLRGLGLLGQYSGTYPFYYGTVNRYAYISDQVSVDGVTQNIWQGTILCGEVLRHIAEVYGCFVQIGYLVISDTTYSPFLQRVELSLADTPITLGTTDYSTFDFDAEDTSGFDNVIVTSLDSTYTATANTNKPYAIMGNRVFNSIYYKSSSYPDQSTATTNIYSMIGGLTYRPCEVETYGNPTYELGNLFNITDLDGNTYVTFAISIEHKGIVGMRTTISAPKSVSYLETETDYQYAEYLSSQATTTASLAGKLDITGGDSTTTAAWNITDSGITISHGASDVLTISSNGAEADFDALSFSGVSDIGDSTHPVYLSNGTLVSASEIPSTSDFVTTSTLASTLTSYVTSTLLTSTLTDYATQSDISDFVTSTTLASTLTDYVTGSVLTSTLSGYATQSDISDFVTSSVLTSTLTDYVTGSVLTSTLSDYVTDSDLTTTLSGYATQSDISDFVTSSVLTSTLSTYVETSDLATVATTGSYSDLTNKPTIPTVNDAALTIQKNGSTVATFTANSSSAVTANITVPTALSELTDDVVSGNYAPMDNGITHNGIYRGENLGTITSTEELETFLTEHDVSGGTFTDLYLGDYITIQDGTYNGVWMIAGFDTQYRKGNSPYISTHHLALIPLATLVDKPMNSTNTTGVSQNSDNPLYATTGGSETAGYQAYYGSDMCQIYMPELVTALDGILSTHLLSQNIQLANTTSSGMSSSWVWYTVRARLMSEIEVYGSVAFASTNRGDLKGIGFDTGVDCEKLPVFNFINHIYRVRAGFWLRSVVSSTRFARADTSGTCTYSDAGGAGGVRPLILIG